jgi:hypothetical protein
MTRPSIPRGEIAIRWIEKYCRRPDNGTAVQLSPEQQATIRASYNTSGAPHAVAVAKDLGAYLTLLHLVGPEGMPGRPVPDFRVDSFTVWRAASPALQAHLQRDGGVIRCLRASRRSTGLRLARKT